MDKVIHQVTKWISALSYNQQAPKSSSSWVVFTYETEFTSVIPPAKLFKALVLDADSLIPKIAPQAVKSAEILKEMEELGTIKKINLAKEEANTATRSISDKIEKISYELSWWHLPTEVSIIRHQQLPTPRGDVRDQGRACQGSGKERAAGLFKIIESHLVANPEAYN
ncbi:hypothetical protein M0R45_025255 [Rubus argutus]|uniref:Uncharacterized protein n=1 Tax=Rubus argutus TaxID=59490 RepID=A0AAW1WU06_RUBAR